jgi:hypothetical protein
MGSAGAGDRAEMDRSRQARRRRVTDPARFNKLMDTGCYPAVAGLRFTRIEHGEEFSLFRMVLSPADKRMGEMPALWYGNSDMRVDGANT